MIAGIVSVVVMFFLGGLARAQPLNHIKSAYHRQTGNAVKLLHTTLRVSSLVAFHSPKPSISQ